MSTPYDHFFWQLRELQRALELAQPQTTSFQVLQDSVQAQLDQFRRLEETFTLPREYLDAFHRIREQIASSPVLEQLPLLTAHSEELLQQFRVQQSELELAMQHIREVQQLHIPPPTEGLADSLVAVEALLSSVEVSETVLQAAILPQRAFQRFVRLQLDGVAAAASSIGMASRLLFVDAASELLAEMTRSFELGVFMAPQLASSELSVDWEVNVFAGLARNAEEAPFEDQAFDAKAFVFDSCEAGIARLGLQLIRLVYDLNTEAEREGRSHVFKPTTKTLYACSLIPAQFATEDESFYHIVDQLYFLLYEGSGDARRLTDTQRPDRFEALWRLKHLRRAGRHDVDHGDKGEIERKQGETGRIFVSLVGAVIPRTSREWCRAQLSLYEQLVAMLEEIWFNEENGSEPSAGAAG